MTCIVGIEEQGRVVLGSDSFLGSPSYGDLTARPKVKRKNGWTFAVAGSSGIVTLVEHLFEWPDPPTRPDDAAVARLASKLGELLLRNDLNVEGSGNGKSLSMEVVVVAAGRLYVVGTALGVTRSRHGYCAAGSGDQYAMGSLASTKGEPALTRARMALVAAATHCPTVSPPFHFRTVPTR